MDTSSLPILVAGFVLGLRHALDADHVVAVSTIVSERRGILRFSIVGAFWGLGHTASLLLMGVAVILLGLRLPDAMAHWLELLVAAMLMGLGAQMLRKLTRGGTLHVHTHGHGERIHVHPHIHEASGEHEHPSPAHHHVVREGRKPFLVGLVHGLAGSAALMLMILTTITSNTEAFVFIGLFGTGSLLGMLLMTTLIGLPVAIAARHRRAKLAIQGSAALLSIMMGVMLTWETAAKLLGS